MNKIALFAASVALTLSIATPAFAEGHGHMSNSLSISNTDTHVTNTVSSTANSGFNVTGNSNNHGHHHGGSSSGNITTGDNVAATSELHNLVNFTQVDCGCSSKGKTSVSNKDTRVTNSVVTTANTGFNTTGSGNIHSGSDVGAGSLVSNEVNTTIFGASSL